MNKFLDYYVNLEEITSEVEDVALLLSEVCENHFALSQPDPKTLQSYYKRFSGLVFMANRLLCDISSRSHILLDEIFDEFEKESSNVSIPTTVTTDESPPISNITELIEKQERRDESKSIRNP